MKPLKFKRTLLVLALMATIMTAMTGGTIAWFTDSVESTANVIQSGNLDIELEYSTDMTTWNTVDTNTKIFKDGALWEPGYTEVVYLRVNNVGNLAAKYQIGINVASETAGTNKAGEEFKLSDYIEYGMKENPAAKYANRADVLNDIGTGVKLNAASAKEYHLLGKTAAATDTDVFALAVYMPESVGNEANHNGTNVPEINLGLTVMATQDTVESDSFDNQYDVNAEYPKLGYTAINSAADLKNAFENAAAGKDVKLYLTENVALDEKLVLDTAANVDLDLSNQTIEGNLPTLIEIKAGNVAIKNGTIKNVNNITSSTQVSVLLSGNAVAEIENVTIETTGKGILLKDNARITELNATIDSHVNANGSYQANAICVNDHARIDLISGGEYNSYYTDEFMDAFTGSFSGTMFYPVSVDGENASIGEISGGTFLGMSADGRNGATVYVRGGKIEKISGGYFGFRKYTFRNYPYNLLEVIHNASIDKITGGAFEHSNGFNCDFETIVAASGSNITVRPEKLTVSVKLSSSTKTSEVEVWDVVPQ